MQNELFFNTTATLKVLKNMNERILFISINAILSANDCTKLFVEAGSFVRDNQFTVATDLLEEFEDSRVLYFS